MFENIFFFCSVFARQRFHNGWLQETQTHRSDSTVVELKEIVLKKYYLRIILNTKTLKHSIKTDLI